MKKSILFVFLILSTVTAMAVISKNDKAVQKQMYTVFFGENGGFNDGFKDPRTGEPPVSLYAPGDLVVFSFEMWATDVSYQFYLDGKEIQASYFDDKSPFCYQFLMPDHDVHFTWTMRNTMIYDPSENRVERE